MPDLNFWNERWETGKIAFHQSDIHFSLTEFAEKFFDRKSEGNILVPLCGKSKDMIFLLSLNYKVFGIEFSKIAVESFFLEAKLNYRVEKLSENENIYYSNNIIIFQGDLFNARKYSSVLEILNQTNYCYDRASMVAFNLKERILYAKFIKELPKLKLILTPLFDYGPRIPKKENEEVGPPFLVSENELQELYQENFKIELLKEKQLNVRENLLKEGITFEKEKVYLLGRK